MQSKHFFPAHPREGGDSSCVEPSSKVLSLGSLGQLLLLLFFSLFYWIYIQAQLKNKMTKMKTSEIDFHTPIGDYCHSQCANSSNFMYVKNKCMSLCEVLVFIVSKYPKPKMIFFVLIRHDGDVNAVCFWGSYLISMLWLYLKTKLLLTWNKESSIEIYGTVLDGSCPRSAPKEPINSWTGKHMSQSSSCALLRD